MSESRLPTIPPDSVLRHPEWSRTSVLYQINVRQFTREGTFEAARAHLPRLQDLGVDVLWLMPIHPIGETNRKGTLGSPYSVRDYRAVNPEFGTEDDLRAFIGDAHARGMRVILDWVPNHTAWDNPLVTEHPDWYARDWKGDFRPTPWWDWSDIIDLDYGNPELWRWMADSLAYWVREFEIDGFRCDVAGMVPIGFWEFVRPELEAIRPVFLLAEWESRDLHRASFDATYAWMWYRVMREIAHGRGTVAELYEYYSWQVKAWPRNAMRMTHVENHDRNAWDGNVFELFGGALEPAIVLSMVGEGIPMMYNGQEVGNAKCLEFFEKDPIEWTDLHPIGELYRHLIALKRDTPALHNGEWGARMIRVPNSDERRVLAFVRLDEHGDGIFAMLNLSDRALDVRLGHGPQGGAWREWSRTSGSTSDEVCGFPADTVIPMEPWGWRVFVRG